VVRAKTEAYAITANLFSAGKLKSIDPTIGAQTRKKKEGEKSEHQRGWFEGNGKGGHRADPELKKKIVGWWITGSGWRGKGNVGVPCY